MPRWPMLCLLALLSVPVHAQDAAPPGQFDLYLFSVSWSPTYCASRAGRADAEQCDGARTYGFVVHGLWPQYAKGGYPAACVAKPVPVPDDVAAAMLDIMPSRTLVAHEWGRHGTCDGTPAADYFAKTREAFAKLRIPAMFQKPKTALVLAPERVEAAFVEVNPGLSADKMAVVCRGRYGAEIRFCLSRALEFAACGPDVRDRCGGEVLFPPVR